MKCWTIFFIEEQQSLLCSVRFLLAVLVFWLNALAYMQRANMSMAVVCMVNHTQVDRLLLDNANANAKHARVSNNNNLPRHENVSCMFEKPTGTRNKVCVFFQTKSVICHVVLFCICYCFCHRTVRLNGTNANKASYSPRSSTATFWRRWFDRWSFHVCFVWLILDVKLSWVFKIAGAWLSVRFGAKLVIQLTCLLASALTLLTPLVAHYSFNMLLVCRFAIGLAQVGDRPPHPNTFGWMKKKTTNIKRCVYVCL